jgi:predicted metal-dependent hydrolase
MPANSNTILSTASSEPVFSAGAITRPLTVRRSHNAKRMRLAVDPRDGTVRLTLPRRAAIGPALRWAETQRDWVEAMLARMTAGVPLHDGARVPFRGATLTITGGSLTRGARQIDDRLIVGGPPELIANRVLRWLRAEALKVLAAETRAAAARAGVEVGRVRVGDARSRWGSCSARGDIAYSWRLILAPPEVLSATVAHEVAHRLHMDHGPAFHAAVADLFGRDPAAERDWLKRHGATLYAVGRSD